MGGSGSPLNRSMWPASLLQRRHDVVLLDPHRPLAEGELEVVVPVLLPQLLAANEVVEVERMKPAHVRRIDQVPRAPEDRHPQPQHPARHQNPPTLPQPRLRHQMQMLEHVQPQNLLAGPIRPRPRQQVEVMHNIDMPRMPPPIVMYIPRRGNGAAAQLQLHSPAPFSAARRLRTPPLASALRARTSARRSGG